MKLLIELPSWLGDAVMATPAIENLISSFGEGEVTIIGSSISTEAIKSHPKINKSIVFNKNYGDIFRISKKLGDFDYFFSFRNTLRSKLLNILIKSKYKFRFEKKKYFDLDIHQVEKYNKFVNESLGFDEAIGKLVLFKTTTKTKRINEKPLLGINPGSSYGSAKRWYPKEFAKVAEKLSKNYNIIIFGSKNEIDIADDIENRLRDNGIDNCVNLSGKTSIEELINQISELDLFITGDSGAMHLAAGFEVPTISIFGPTRHKETSQWKNKKSIIVKENLDCQPCMKRTCPLKHHNCMKLIKAERILDAVSTLN